MSFGIFQSYLFKRIIFSRAYNAQFKFSINRINRKYRIAHNPVQNRQVKLIELFLRAPPFLKMILLSQPLHHFLWQFSSIFYEIDELAKKYCHFDTFKRINTKQ